MTQMTISIGSDHAGFDCKEFIKKAATASGKYQLTDAGTYSADSVDYPDFAHRVAENVISNQSHFGVVICGSGNGVCITANKHKGIRAALCWTKEIALLARQHNDANVLCIPARFVSHETALDMFETFMNTAFEGGRHERRVEKIDL